MLGDVKIEWGDIKPPPAYGPGSGKDAWKAFALRTADANDRLVGIVDAQAAAIRDLQAEIVLLRQQAADRQPKGGRAPLPDEVVERIERDLAAGMSYRVSAKRHGVSHASVQRVQQRIWARRALGA